MFIFFKDEFNQLIIILLITCICLYFYSIFYKSKLEYSLKNFIIGALIFGFIPSYFNIEIYFWLLVDVVLIIAILVAIIKKRKNIDKEKQDVGINK